MELGYADSMKQYKANPQVYKGHIGDISMVLRAAVANRKQTPDLFSVMRIMGGRRVCDRLEQFRKNMYSYYNFIPQG